MKIRDGELEGFKPHAAEIMRQMLEQEEKPLRYDWFLNDEGTECVVCEAYVDADSLLDHQRSIVGPCSSSFRA